MKELGKLAYQLVVQNGCRHLFKEDTEMAGENCAKCLMRRYSEYKLEKARGNFWSACDAV